MSRPHPIRDARLALSLMTVVPVGSTWPEGESTQVAAWFPWIGGLFGAVGYALVRLGGHFGVEQRAPLVLGAIVVAVWALFSRLLHWDGLADVFDGMWGSDDKQRRLEIMSDSHIGAFGATGVTLVALLEVLAVGTIIGRPHELPILVVPVFSRFASTAAAWLGSPARPNGLGRSVMGHPTTLGLVIGVIPLAAALSGMWFGFEAFGLVFSVFGLLLAFTVPHVLARRFGGVTGDVMGASIMITEAVMFAAFALAR